MKRLLEHQLAALLALALLLASPASAYIGPKDEFGCNTDPKTGRYECHDRENNPDVEESRFYLDVVEVPDGNTLLVTRKGYGKVKVRLIGVLAPYAHSPHAYSQEAIDRAREHLASLLDGRGVKLHYEKVKFDGLKRILAYVYTREGRFLNEQMVRDGYALATRVEGFSPEIMDRLAEAEKEARAAGRGLWSDPENLIPPKKPTPAK